MKQSVDICMTLDKSRYEKHKADVAVLTDKRAMDVTEDDLVKLKYKFFIHYIGDIARKLEAVGNICDDPAVVRDIKCWQLKEGRILIYEVLKKLDRLIK